ncbi:MAG: HD domain-containing phosphohydrolase, partial [bacterium]|nr:HD domain-containing phosphohydrolase [bacterium]
HAVHVCMLGVALAKRALGISKEEALHRFGPGLLLHDLGLTEMPKDLYERYDPLNPILESEFRRHPEAGLALVQEFMDLTPESESIILHHHERLDGSGFPMGIAGDELSDGAKICAIVDTFDLLNTRTRYRERLPSFEALKAMKRGVPWQLDESLFHEFVRIFLPPF